jgi:hypothetical protein
VTGSVPEPLWKTVVVGETEPWRRGRLFLIFYAVINLANQGILLADLVFRGLLDPLIFSGAIAVLFWLQFYFIWIGVSWIRWVHAGLVLLIGFALTIWGVLYGVPLWIGVGLLNFALGAYLGLAPSVFFFGQRQRENRRWIDALVVAGVFLLVLGSLAAGVAGLAGYRASRLVEAREFADRAFRHIFTEHDTRFLTEHATERLMKDGGGMGALTKFLQDATMRAGDVHDIKPATGALHSWYHFPLSIGFYGEVNSEGVGDRGPIRLSMRIGEDGREWQIDAVWWRYLSSSPKN